MVAYHKREHKWKDEVGQKEDEEKRWKSPMKKEEGELLRQQDQGGTGVGQYVNDWM